MGQYTKRAYPNIVGILTFSEDPPTQTLAERQYLIIPPSLDPKLKGIKSYLSSSCPSPTSHLLGAAEIYNFPDLFVFFQNLKTGPRPSKKRGTRLKADTWTRKGQVRVECGRKMKRTGIGKEEGREEAKARQSKAKGIPGTRPKTFRTLSLTTGVTNSGILDCPVNYGDVKRHRIRGRTEPKSFPARMVKAHAPQTPSSAAFG